MIIPDEACKIWISNREEFYEFLSACQNQDIRWVSGRQALFWYENHEMESPMCVALFEWRESPNNRMCDRMFKISSKAQFDRQPGRDITAEFFADVKMPDSHTVLEAAWI